MSCACAPLSGETNCEPNMGDVLGKEPEEREDQFSDQFGENMEREEAEGAEAEEEKPSTSCAADLESSISPGNPEQAEVDETPQVPESEVDENIINEVKENQSVEASDAASMASAEMSDGPLVPPEHGMWDHANLDMEFVADADDEDDEDEDEDDDDDDEEGGVDADDEDDFADNETAERTSSLANILSADDLQTKRNEEIKVNSDVYSYSDSSDDSVSRNMNKSSSGGRICDSVRRRKLNKVKECLPARANIPSEVDERAVLSEAMANLSIDSERPPKLCEGNGSNQNVERVTSEGIFDRVVIPDELQMPEDLVTKTESESEASQTQPVERVAPKSDGALTTEEENSSLNEEDIKELMRQEALQRRRESCTCEACQSKRLQMQEQRKLQGAWMELRLFVRGVYQIIMDTPPDGAMPIVESSQDEHMKAIAKRLTKSDPHQLYHRLQAQVHEFATAVRRRLREITEDNSGNSLVATDFFEGLFHGYDKLTAAAKRVAPLLEDLELRHLSRFNLTWELLNKAIYFQTVYNDECISNKLPEMVTLGQEFKDMIRFYVDFDDEMSIIRAMWQESYDLLQKYNNQQAKIRAKQQMLLRDWEIFKAQRKRLQSSFDEGIELDRHNAVAENGSDVDGPDMVVCPSCNRVQSCSCDECCLAHLFSCPAHQPAMRAEYSPTMDGPRVAGDGAGDGPTVEHNDQGNEQNCECHVCTAPPGGPEIDGVSACAPGCFCNAQEEGRPQVSQSPSHQFPSPPYQFSSQQSGGGDGNGVYPHLYNVHPSLLNTAGTKPLSNADMNEIPDARDRDLVKPALQGGSVNLCPNLGHQNMEKDQVKSNVKILKAVKQGDKKCNLHISSSKNITVDPQQTNGAPRNEAPAGGISPTSEVKTVSFTARDPQNQLLPSSSSSQTQQKPQPRARFTAGPGVNVPDTDIYPDPPTDFAAPPLEFTGEVSTVASLKSEDVACNQPVALAANSKPEAAGTQEPVFVLTKTGTVPPTHISSLQGVPTAPPVTTKEKSAENSVLSSQANSTPPPTAKIVSAGPGGPSIQGLLEEALERKKAEMARAAAAAARESSRTVSTPAGSIPGTQTSTAPPTKSKQGHTCSSAKHKLHTHSPSHRDPKNCDCCFCEMFGHGAPPAAPTSHRFHENRQRLRSKLNKSRASKQQAAGLKPGAAAAGAARPGGAGAAPVAAVKPAGAAVRPAAVGAPAAGTVAAAATAATATNAATAASAATARLTTAAAAAAARPAALRPAGVGAPASACPPGPAGASVAVKTAAPVAAAGTVTRTMTASARVPGAAPVSGATAARAIAYSVTNGSGSNRLGTAFTSSVGKSTASCPPQAANAIRPSHVAAAKMAEAGMSKMKAQPVTSVKPTVTTSNQRIVATAPAAAKGIVQQAPQLSQAAQTAQAAPTAATQKKVVLPAVPREEPVVKKDDPRPIDELLDFIEGGANAQLKTGDSKKAAKKARQKQKKLEQQIEEENFNSPDVTITMLKDSSDADRSSKGNKKGGKRTEELISTIPSATAQSIRDRIKSQVGEVAKKMGTSDQPQMVTIRRVMEPNSSEPTVTITLKGATPDKDKVLFTLVNGQNEVVCHDQASTMPKSKKQRKLERRLLRQQQQQQIQVEAGDEEEEYEDDYAQEEEEIDLSSLTKTQRKKLRRLQRKQEEERLAEEQRQREEQERLRLEEERRKREEAERLQQQKSKKNSKKEKVQKPQSQPQTNTKKTVKPAQKTQTAPEPSLKPGKGSKVNSAPDSDDEFAVPVQMTKKERKKARKLQQQLEEELRRQRQKEEEEREKQRQVELKEQKKKQKEMQKLKQQQQKQLEKQQQKQKEADKKQQKQSKSQAAAQQQQQQQSQKQKQKQAPKQQQSKLTKQSGRITTSIITNPHTLGSYMPPVGSLEWTTQALAASRPNVTIQPASATSSSLGGLEQRFSTTLTLNGKPILPPPRHPSPEPSQDFSLENLKLPPGITITKVDPSQVQQRKPPVSKPQVTKTVVSNPAPTTIIAAPLSGNRPPNNFNSAGGQDPNSNVIVVDTGKLKQDIAKREEEPEQVVTRKKKNNKNKKAPEPTPRQQIPSQLSPFLYGMNSVSITPAGQAASHQAAPPPPQAAIIKMNGNMVTIRNPAIHPTPQRYIAPEVGEKETPSVRKVVANGGQNNQPTRNKESSSLPPRFANAKLSQQTNGVNGYIPHRPQLYEAAPQTFEVPKPHKLHYEAPPRHFESRHFEAPRHFEQASHYDGNTLHFERSTHHYDSKSHHFDAASRQYEPSSHHFDHSGRHFEAPSRPFEHAGRHFETAPHHYEHTALHCDQSGHHFNPPTQQISGLSMHDKHTKHIHPQNYAAAIEGKKNKLKKAYNNDDWQLVDSVFAPKDIDLDDGDIDADERELEAFKRFCLQSVPPKRKEKVHLNIEDIVLKKKSSIVSCT